MGKNRRLRKINTEDFAKRKKIRTFANDEDDYEPTALAFTDFTKPSPILEGKDAERFLKHMEEVELEVERRENIPPTLEELKTRLSYEELALSLDKDMIAFREKDISELKDKIKELEEKNGKTEER